MKKLVVGSVIGIAGLGVVSFVGILLATREPPPAPPPSAIGADWSGAVAESASRRAAGGPSYQPLQPPPPPMVIVKDVAPPPPPPGSWESVPIVAPRTRAYGLDMEALAPKLAECFDPSVAARGGPVSEVKDHAADQEEFATTLILQLEVSGDRLWVVDAPIESRGQASDGTISCAQAVLRRETAPAGAFRPGKHRLRFPLLQQ